MFSLSSLSSRNARRGDAHARALLAGGAAALQGALPRARAARGRGPRRAAGGGAAGARRAEPRRRGSLPAFSISSSHLT